MIINDWLAPAQLTGFVREVPTPSALTLNRFLPDRQINDIEAEMDSLTRTNRAAKFRAYDAETPIGRRDVWESKRFKLPPLGQKLPIGEFERLTLERIRTGGDNRAGIINAIYDDAETNTRAILNRMELARGDVLQDAKFTLTAENGLTIEADFGLPASHIVSAATVWNDAANASPLADLRAWISTYVADTGERPAYMLLSESAYSALLLSQEIRELSATLAGTPNLVSDSQLQQVMSAFRLPQLVTYDTLLDVDGTSKRVLDQRKAILLPQDPASLGFTAWGITAEALELAGGQNPSLEFTQLPGLVGVVLKEGDPVRVWTKVGAVGMPIITDPRRLMVATVL